MGSLMHIRLLMQLTAYDETSNRTVMFVAARQDGIQRMTGIGTENEAGAGGVLR